MSLLDHHGPQSWRFYYYGDDSEGDPLFSFWMNIDDTTGVCIYERNNGAGKWLPTDHEEEEEYGALEPTDELKDALRAAVDSDSKGVDGSRVESLPNYEQYFFQVVHGTIEEKHKAPAELLAFLEAICETELRIEEVADDE